MFLFRDDILDIYYQLSLNLPEMEQVAETIISQAGKQISLPPPIELSREEAESFLTQAGIIEQTNEQRKEYNLGVLKENAWLDTAAEIKLEDMLAKQYFAHESPAGDSVGDWADLVGYQFIAMGENLALGNFQDDETLVLGWMDSPGHRDNILNESYQEIGVAVGKGVFEGQTTWLAVQHFGMPLSACDQLDPALEQEIQANENEILELKSTLRLLRSEIRSIGFRRGAKYKSLIEQYNDLVFQYNSLIEETEELIANYNQQVILFNQCVGQI